MRKSIELKQAIVSNADEARKILDTVEGEKRGLTTEEEKEYRRICDRGTSLSHELVETETREELEAEEAARLTGAVVATSGSRAWKRASWSWSASDGVVRAGSLSDEGVEVGEVLRPDQSVRSFMERRGLLRQDKYEKVTMGKLLAGLVSPSKDPEVRAALAEGSDATGGISVPDITLARFIDKLRANIVCMQAGAVTVPLTSDRTTIARTAADAVASWRAEAGAVTASEPTFEGLVFQPKSLAVLVKASREVVEDSVNIERALEQSLIGALSVELDRVALIGSGTPPEPRGISNTTNIGSVAGGGALTSYDKILDACYEMLVDNAGLPTAIVMPPRTMIALAKLKAATTNEPLPPPPLLANIPQYQTTSLPINEAPGTASRIIMGNFTQLYFGIRTQLRIEVLRELFAENLQFGFIAFLRADVGVAHPESFAQVTGIVP